MRSMHLREANWKVTTSLTTCQNTAYVPKWLSMFLTWARLRPADHWPNNCKYDSQNKKTTTTSKHPWKLRCWKTSSYRKFGVEIFDFDPQFLAGQITGQSFWDRKIREVGQSFWEGGVSHEWGHPKESSSMECTMQYGPKHSFGSMGEDVFIKCSKPKKFLDPPSPQKRKLPKYDLWWPHHQHGQTY